MIEEAISRGILPEIKKRKDTMMFTKCINLNTKRKGGEIRARLTRRRLHATHACVEGSTPRISVRVEPVDC